MILLNRMISKWLTFIVTSSFSCLLFKNLSYCVLFEEFGNRDNVFNLLNIIKADNDKDTLFVFEFMGNSVRCVNFNVLLLQEFGNHDNVIKLLNVIKADNDKDIYLVFEFMGNLFSYLTLLICIKLCNIPTTMSFGHSGLLVRLSFILHHFQTSQNHCQGKYGEKC